MRHIINWLLSYWSKVADLFFPNRNQNQQKDKQSDVQSQPVHNLHYSIPGKAFTGSVNKGHVVKTENKWPLSGR